jgi:hypothetical protein
VNAIQAPIESGDADVREVADVALRPAARGEKVGLCICPPSHAACQSAGGPDSALPDSAAARRRTVGDS